MHLDNSLVVFLLLQPLHQKAQWSWSQIEQRSSKNAFLAFEPDILLKTVTFPHHDSDDADDDDNSNVELLMSFAFEQIAAH